MIPRIHLARGHTDVVETKARPLRVTLELESIRDGEACDALLGALGVCADICDNERLEVWSTRAGTFQHFAVGAVVPGEDVAPLPTAGGFAGFVFPVSQYVRRAEEAAASGELDRDEALRLLLLAAGAASRQADAFVTDHPFLLRRRSADGTHTGNAMSAHEALALIGLYLRLRDDWGPRS